jgi:tRNA threonylcarbamoyladenosine biosynthesis protein TsaE
MRWHSRSPEETRAAARDLALAIGAEGAAVALLGELGAGKTAFAKGVAEGLGVPPELVASPTFTIAQELPTPGGLRLVHADLFRVGSFAELEAAGFDDWLGPDVLLLVEWADRLPGALPDDHLEIRLERSGDEAGRALAVRAHGAASRALLDRWERRRGRPAFP